MPPAVMAERTGGELLKKIKELYPLRGKISQVTGKEARLNIGRRTGVRLGQRFRVTGCDTVLEGIEVEPDSTLARLISGKDPLAKGLRVEAIE